MRPREGALLVFFLCEVWCYFNNLLYGMFNPALELGVGRLGMLVDVII